MIISHRRKYLYFVVPKCASATLRQSLAEHTDIGYPVTDYPQHLTMAEFMRTEHAPLMDDYFKFTFVRHPYDRLYSGYLQDRLASERYEGWIEAKGPIFRDPEMSFERYMLDHVRQADIHTAWGWICFTPMCDFAFWEGEFRLDWFGRAEHFDADLARLSAKIGAPISRAEDRNVNTPPSTGLKYRDKYSRPMIEWVNETYRQDFEVFGYEPLDPSLFPATAPA